ncbi:MAG TPA: hypothetical protein VFH99_00070 [Candidatus Saccharimonadales bacterium]|nr:hypothetical protein [Candidatus Saccharimonadales bacterium]
MKTDRTFEGELSDQKSLSDHLVRRALEAHETGDVEAFQYASEVYEETQQRIRSVALASRSIQNAVAVYRINHAHADFGEYLSEGAPEIDLHRAMGAMAVGSTVLSNELQTIDL